MISIETLVICGDMMILGSSPDSMFSETYRGASAFSEPEAQAIRDFAILNNYGTHFNMHTFGGYILYPWGYIDAETPDSLTYREFAALLTSYSGYALWFRWSASWL
ncbi:MAG: hypothetical protein MZV64_44560 [Ignavibacteriales bacterium]|nr:hypothetical protein [Ignavibacteriales bacterium]